MRDMAAAFTESGSLIFSANVADQLVHCKFDASERAARLAKWQLNGFDGQVIGKPGYVWILSAALTGMMCQMYYRS
jgi:hypothetical protein